MKRNLIFNTIRLCCVGLMMLAWMPAMGQKRDRLWLEDMKTRFRTYYANDKIDEALTVNAELIDYYGEIDSLEKESNARWTRIAILNNSSRYDSLLVEARRQREWFKQKQIWDRYYQSWQRICSAHHDLGHMKSALDEAQAMSNDAQQRDNKIGRAMAYKQMGVIYFDIRQMEQATEVFRQSIKLLREEGEDTGILSGVYDGMCQTLDRREMYDEELHMAEEWLTHLGIVAKKHSINFVAPTYVSCYLAHAAAYLGRKQFDEVRRAISKAEEYQQMGNTALPKYYVYEMRMRLALAEGRSNDAIAYSDSAIALDIRVDEKIDELRANALLQTGRGMESALLYRSLYDRKDSLFTRDLRNHLDELNTMFQIDELKRQQEQARQYFAMTISALILVTLVIITLLTLRSSKRLRLKNNELAAMNDDLQKANERAKESSRMKSEFIKNISHEIRTPLNVLSGFTQVLTSSARPMPKDELDVIHTRINESTDRITGLVNKMLELSEISSHTTIERNDHTTPEALARQAVKDSGMERFDHARVAFRMEVDAAAQSAELTTNLRHAVQALCMLLDNALKFTRDGQIRLVVGFDAERRQATWTVEDTGIGIPKGEEEHIFEEFVQMDKFSDGTGIGLTLARSSVRRMGGDVVLDTSYTDGARFVMSLPTDQKDA